MLYATISMPPSVLYTVIIYVYVTLFHFPSPGTYIFFFTTNNLDLLFRRYGCHMYFVHADTGRA